MKTVLCKKFVLVLLMVVAMVASQTMASNMVFNANPGTSWHDAENWYYFAYYALGDPAGRVPTSGDTVYLSNAQQVDISGAAYAETLVSGEWRGYGSSSAYLNINAGANLNTAAITTGNGAGSWITQNGGAVSTRWLSVGSQADSINNYYQLNDGTVTVSNGYMAIGRNSATDKGYFTQTGGTVSTPLLYLAIDGGHGEYNMTGGTLTLGSGTTYMGYWGGVGTAVFNLGNATQSNGTVTSDGKVNLGSGSIIHGWGTLGFNGGSALNGKVQADGFGVERTLAISGGASNTDLSATAGDGFYAVNKGKLTLPSIAVSVGNTGYSWGGDGSALTDRVNSLKVYTAGGVSTPGALSISLLATDRSDVGDASQMIGVWLLTGNTLEFSGAELTFRFDDVLAAIKGINEADLGVYSLLSGVWTLQGGTIDTANNLITLAGVNFDSSAMYAVGIPEPATLTILVIGCLSVLKRRH